MRYDDFRPRNTIEVCCFIGVTDTTSRNLVFQAQIDRRHQCDLYAYVIPTERVVSGTRGLPPPPMARAWGLNSEWAMRFGVPAERCKDDKGRDRTVYLVEHFEDGGSDGHTDYHLAGWFVELNVAIHHSVRVCFQHQQTLAVTTLPVPIWHTLNKCRLVLQQFV